MRARMAIAAIALVMLFGLARPVQATNRYDTAGRTFLIDTSDQVSRIEALKGAPSDTQDVWDLTPGRRITVTMDKDLVCKGIRLGTYKIREENAWVIDAAGAGKNLKLSFAGTLPNPAGGRCESGFMPEYSSFASLICLGNAQHRVTLGRATSEGYWHGQFFGSSLKIKHTTIEHADSFGVYCYGGTFFMADSTVSNSLQQALFLRGLVGVTLINNRFDGDKGSMCWIEDGSGVPVFMGVGNNSFGGIRLIAVLWETKGDAIAGVISGSGSLVVRDYAGRPGDYRIWAGESGLSLSELAQPFNAQDDVTVAAGAFTLNAAGACRNLAVADGAKLCLAGHSLIVKGQVIGEERIIRKSGDIVRAP